MQEWMNGLFTCLEEYVKNVLALFQTFELAVSKIVSTSSISAPPSSSPLACSVYAFTSSSKAKQQNDTHY